MSRKIIHPLPYSAVPAELAPLFGAMSLAFQRIEDEIPRLIESVAQVDEAVLNILLSRISTIAVRLVILKELSAHCLDESSDVAMINALVERVDEVRKQRNEFIHSANVAFDKQTGAALFANRKRREAKWLGNQDLQLVTSRMYLILEALDQRSAGVDKWDAPLKHWRAPETFWKRARRSPSNLKTR